MKKICALLIGFAIVGCNDGLKDFSHESGQDQHHSAIELNKGQKWSINDEMKPFIEKSKAMTNSYLQNNSTDYYTLAGDLQTQNNQLIKSCKMDGKGHDELHKWLHPHLKLVSDLEQANNAQEANLIVISIKESFETFDRHFR